MSERRKFLKEMRSGDLVAASDDARATDEEMRALLRAFTATWPLGTSKGERVGCQLDKLDGEPVKFIVFYDCPVH